MASIAIAVVALAIVGGARPQTSEPPGAATPSAVAAAPSSTSGPASSTDVPTDQAATPTERASPSFSPPPPSATATSKPAPTPKPTACLPTDQDQYVYNPDRLDAQAACIHVTGTVEAVRREADGDLHILLALDPAFAYLLTPANQGEELGDLVVEPACVKPVTQTDAIAICASDPDPLAGPFPSVGDTIWMEGRYVFDLEHSGWAEFHPLYRWGF